MRLIAIPNPLRIIDWETKSFLKVVLAIQVAMWVVVGLEAVGVHIPFLTELIGFIYLTFVPGVVILRALRLHKLGSIKTLLYSVGLSVATVMFVGLMVNTVGSAIGVSAPLSPLSLIVAFSIITLVLCALSYIRDRDFAEPGFIEVREILSPPVLFLILLPFLSILGAFVLNNYQNNTLLLCLMAIIAVVVALVGFNRFIGKNLYPVAIVMIAFALLYHFQLSFSNLAGTDIQGEYAVFKLTEINSQWIPRVGWLANYSDMLSITILPVAYSYLLGMDGIGVFKLLYPFLFALVPLGLYEVYRHQTEERTAFLSAFFFMSFGAFLSTLVFLARMQVAELFFVLLIVLILSKELDLTKRVALFIIFAFSLVVSHYGLNYYFIFYLFLAWLFPIFMKWATKQDSRGEVLTVTLIILCLVVSLLWYMYISNAAILRGSVDVAEYIWGGISDIFSLEAMDVKLLQGLGLAEVGMYEHSFQREIAGWLYRVTYIMVIVGVIRWIVRHREMKFTPAYIGLALAGMLTMLACVVIPRFSYGAMETNRTFHIALFFLAPFCILGGETIFDGIKRLFRRIRKQAGAGAMQKSTVHLLIIFLVLIPYFLFNVGFIFEVTGDPPSSLTLGKERLRISSNEMVKASFHNVTLRDQEISASEWLSRHMYDDAQVYGDQISRDRMAVYGLIDQEFFIDRQHIRRFQLGGEFEREAYIYLRSFNTTEHLVVLIRPRRILGATRWMLLADVGVVLPRIEEYRLIYSNGGSQIYYIARR